MTKEKKIKIMLGLGIGVAIILLVSVLKALLFGTAYLVAAAAIGAAAFLFAPTIINWLSVKAIAGARATAARDPINQLIVLQRKRCVQIEKGRQHLEKQKTVVSKYKRNCDDMIKKNPAKEAELMKRLGMFEDMLAYRVGLYVQAKHSYSEGQSQLDDLEIEYENAMAAYEAGAAFDMGNDFFDKLLEKTAIKAVGEATDRAVAQLELAMVDAEVAKAIAGKTQHKVSYDANGDIILGDILTHLAVRA